MLTNEEQMRRAKLIGDANGGIYPPNEIYYLSHIAHASQLCLRSFEQFEALSRAPDRLAKPDSAFEALQMGLSHAAAVSRFFWSSRLGLAGLSGKRAMKLRRAFAIDTTSPLRDRSLRDAIEHFDERLDEYLLDPRYGDIVTASIGSDAQSSTHGVFSLRHINIVGGEVELLGRRYSYQPIKMEIRRVALVAGEFLANGCRLPTSS